MDLDRVVFYNGKDTMSIQCHVVVRKGICFVLILSLFFSCAAPMHGRRGEEKETDKNLPSAQGDSLHVVVSEEDIQKEMQFGFKEKAAALIIGSMVGLILGARVAFGATGSRGDVGSVYAFFIGGGVGLPIGATCNYHIIKSLAREHARERIVRGKRTEEEKEE